MTVIASCHCGEVRLSFPGLPEEAISCNCSHCAKKGFLLAFFPSDQVKVETGTDKLSTYSFNKHVIRHRFCPTCGTQVFAEGKMPDGSPATAVNLRCVDGVDISVLAIKEVDGRSY